MNILFLINHAGAGGSEKYVNVLSKYLIKNNNNVFLIYNEGGKLVDDLKVLKILSDKVEMNSPFDRHAIEYIKDFCTTKKIDIIHTQFQRENYIALQVKQKLNDLKVIYTSHIITEDIFFKKIINKIMTKSNDKIIAVSSKGKESLIKNNYPKSKIKIIFNGVPYNNYVHNVTNSTIRNEFSIPVDEFIFVSVGRLSFEKGFIFLLESTKLLTKLIDIPFKLMLVGDGDEYKSLKKYADDNSEIANKIIFTGFRKDVDNILKGCNCFINSSINENLSFAILEAMSFGLPIIATRVGGNPDIINNKTNAGILIRYNSKIAMARGMEKMMTDTKFYKESSKNANKAIEYIFNIDKVSSETLKLYHEVKGETN